MQTLALPVFTFTELTVSAQNKAREGLRAIAYVDQWWDNVFDDVDAIAYLMGISIDRRTCRGRTINSPDILFSGFCSQGDGASFTGRISPRPNIGAAVRDHAPLDVELHSIADQLEAVYQALPVDCSARIERLSSRYVHDNTTYVELDEDTSESVSVTQRHALEACCKRLMRWTYKQLEQQSDWLVSDEALADLAVGLSRLFTAEGEDVTGLANDLMSLPAA